MFGCMLGISRHLKLDLKVQQDVERPADARLFRDILAGQLREPIYDDSQKKCGAHRKSVSEVLLQLTANLLPQATQTSHFRRSTSSPVMCRAAASSSAQEPKSQIIASCTGSCTGVLDGNHFGRIMTTPELTAPIGFERIDKGCADQRRHCQTSPVPTQPLNAVIMKQVVEDILTAHSGHPKGREAQLPFSSSKSNLM
ncbi:hypothetical protein B0H16DRAFT_1454779 [Mycena metata]|uniref:Uncharacterized protein n=1 Tax=Mycena metata TaxID=1033252 RepID=A0AAD7JIV5_9AGAR|nr:hypothetical protein B0H16DRAFT_1454779 [Mycena metata]